MELEFEGEIFHWRGPSPYHFVAVPEPEAGLLQSASTVLTYGWGMIPVSAAVGTTRWTTSLFPKDGGYLVPVKDAVRRGEGLEVGDLITVRLSLAI